MKKKTCLKTLCILGTLLACLGGWGITGYAKEQLMPIDDIRPGMKGVGKTVFSGTKVEDFDVEIVAVLKNIGPHSDAILAKISGGPLPLEKSGVIAGMSGSPIYIDGKLIGALSFATTIFAKEPYIAGITPIHEMLRDAKRLDAPAKNAAQPLTLAALSKSGNATSLPSGFAPIQTPLMVSGVDARVLAFMQEQFAPLQMTPVQGGNVSSKTAQESSAPMIPGSAVGIALVQGDMDINATGTVTYRDGKTLLAFGHPMFSAGSINFPMTSEYIHLVLSNQILSSKMSSPIKNIGAITKDFNTGISGVIGGVAPMIPFHVTVQRDGEPSYREEYAFEIFDFPMLTPMLLQIAGANALLATEKSMGDFTMRTKLNVTLADHAPFSVEEIFTGNEDLLAPVVQSFAPVEMLLRNNFEQVALKDVSLEIVVENAMRSAEIKGIRVRDAVVRPGEEVELTITLQPYGQELTTITDIIKIPDEIQSGMYPLFVGDATANIAFEFARAPQQFQPQTVPQLLQLFHKNISQNTIVVSLFYPAPGIVVQGQELPSPPLSMMAMMGAAKQYAGKNALTRGQVLARKQIPTPFVVSGWAGLMLIVDHTSPEYPGAMEQQPTPLLQQQEGEIRP